MTALRSNASPSYLASNIAAPGRTRPKGYGVTVAALDKEVSERRKQCAEESSPSAWPHWEVELWAEPVDQRATVPGGNRAHSKTRRADGGSGHDRGLVGHVHVGA